MGTLYYGTADKPEASALDELTTFLNELRADGRPAFVAFDAEFPGLLERPDWLEHFCRGCGLAHHFVGGPVILALMRYQVREVADFYPRHSSTVFAVPTVLDQPFYNVFCPAPVGAAWGHAAALNEDGGELVAEVIHARIDYQPRHWVRVGIMLGNRFDDSDINGLRKRHLDRLRSRSGRPDFGSHC